MCSTGSSCGQQVSTLIILLEYQTVMHYLMPVIQLYIFLAQWRLVLSESAVYLFGYMTRYYYLLLSLLPWQWFSFTITLYHKIHELFYLWCQSDLKLQENCAINAQAANHLKTAVIVTFLARSLALHRTAEPQEALWHFILWCPRMSLHLIFRSMMSQNEFTTITCDISFYDVPEWVHHNK